MISKDILEECVRRAGLAPTVHNTQPARWRQDGDVLSLFCETDVGLTIGDPTGRDAALSCGAVLEGMVLALSAHKIAADVMLTDNNCRPGQGLVAVAHLTFSDGDEDGLHAQLERRFTWRGPFAPDTAQLFGWTRADARLILDDPSRKWLAERSDHASFKIMQDGDYRIELVNWMRLKPRHPRAGLDGMDRAAMRMSGIEALAAPLVLRRFWGVLNSIGLTRSLTSEVESTLTSPVITLFDRGISENRVASGLAYLRMCLEAASLGLAGWPMAAVADDVGTNRQVCERFGIPTDRRLIQAVRFGVPTGDAPPRARRPLREVLR